MTDSSTPHIEDFKHIDVVKHIGNPESMLLWRKEVAAAQDGRLPPTTCMHPMNAIAEFVDEEPGREGRPTNLYSCTICHRLLRLVDAHGKEALDG